MKWFTYNILFAVGYTLMLPKFFLRMLKRGGYSQGFTQRLGRYDESTLSKLTDKRRIWIHAVSVGEVFVALRFIKELRSRDDGAVFLLSTTTSTGHRIAADRLNDDDVLIYYPADFPGVVRRVLDVIKPRAFILTESEIWPNMIMELNRRAVPVVLINGRLSEKSFRGYLKLKMFFGEVLRAMSLFLVQTLREKEMLALLGADNDKIKVMGTAKYDVAQADTKGSEEVRDWLSGLGVVAADPLIVGGSTWPGEEAVLLDIFLKARSAHKGLKLILVPRHAERRVEVEGEITKRGLSYVKRSTHREGKAEADVVLVDTTGELMSFYETASVIFVGKSLENKGGQNIIEPALLGKAIVVGPNMSNFPVVAKEFVEAGAMLQVQDAAGLQQAIMQLMGDEAKREELGRKAAALVQDKRGAVAESVSLILPLLSV